MQHRFTLRRLPDGLVLTVCDWQGRGMDPCEGELIATQIVEDFTPRDYFLGIVRDVFGDSDGSVEKTGLTLRWSWSESVLDDVLRRMNLLASPERYGRTSEGYIGLIGRTPLLKLGRLAEDCKATVLVKLECMEPNSVKDRPVRSIVEEALRRGDITEATEVVEASSGNVAFALSAILQAVMDKKPKIFISKMHGEEKRRAVRVIEIEVGVGAQS